MDTRWLNYFWQMALLSASMSKDENTKVGACIFDEYEKIPVSQGWNCLPRGVQHKEGRNARPLKYKLTSHAEISAITNAARQGRITNGKSIITTLCPCSLCACALINAGIKHVYTPQPDFNHEQYGEEFRLSLMMFNEADVDVSFINNLLED